MRTPQLTAQYGQVDRVSVARAIFSSFNCATAGVRSNPRREKPAPPTSAPLRNVLRESSIVHPPTASITSRADCTPTFAGNYNPVPQRQSTELSPPRSAEYRVKPRSRYQVLGTRHSSVVKDLPHLLAALRGP